MKLKRRAGYCGKTFRTILRFPRGQLEIAVQCFEWTGKKVCDFVEVRKKVTVQQFEEVEKKPAGFF